MRSLSIPHTNYRFACFTPTFSKYTGKTACGLQTYVSIAENKAHEYADFDPVYVGTALLWAAKHLYTIDGYDGGKGNTTDGFHWIFAGGTMEYDIDVLVGGPVVRESIDAGLSPEEVRQRWMPELEVFREKRKKYLLY